MSAHQGFTFYAIALKPVEPRARAVGSDENLVLVWPLADKANLGGVWARTPVRATGHPNDDLFVLEPELAQQLLDPCEQVRHHPLRFRQRQAARWQGRTGHRCPADDARLVFDLHPVFAED